MNKTHTKESTVAIIVSTYNRRDFLPDCVRSCLFQDKIPDCNTRVIVVDDGSTDNSFEMLQSLFELNIDPLNPNFCSNHNLDVIRITNSERGKARNTGAFHAIKTYNAKFLLFNDSDDVLTQNTVAQFWARWLETQSQNPVAIYADTVLWFGERKVSKMVLNAGPRPQGDLKKVVCKQALLSLATTFIRADVFLKIGGFSEDRLMSGSEDRDLWCRLSCEGPLFYAGHIAAWYRQHPGNTRAEQFERSAFRSLASVLNYYRTRFSENEFREMQREASIYVRRVAAGNFIFENKLRKAFSHLWALFRAYPSSFLLPKSWRLLLSFGIRKFKTLAE